jgi:hypothetical protein
MVAGVVSIGGEMKTTITVTAEFLVLDAGFEYEMIRNIRIPGVSCCVHSSLESLLGKLGSNPHQAIVISNPGGSSMELAFVLMHLRNTRHSCPIYLIDRGIKTYVSKVWPVQAAAKHPRKHEVSSVESLCAVLAELLDPKPSTPRAPRLTRTQVALLEMVARGFSNGEIAFERETSLRAVEALIQRTFIRLGYSPSQLSTRQRVVLAQQILGELEA